MVAAALVAAAPALAADVRVLTTSGIKVDGLGIAGLAEPVAGADGAVFFRGANTKLEIAGQSFASGDPLPASLPGTFEEILEGVTAGSRGAVLTAANGSAVASAIFIIEGETVTPLVTSAPADGTALQRVTMNARGDVAYLAATGSLRELYVLPRATGLPVRIAGQETSLRSLRGFAIDESGAVAWMDRRGEVFHWDAVHGLREVTRLRRTTGSPRSGVALHATFGLAAVGRDFLVRWSPDSGAGENVLHRRESVDGARITRFYADVGFLDDGTITARVKAKKSSSKYACVNAGIVLCDTPGASGAGTAVVPDRTSAVFRLNGSDIVPVVRPGDVLPGVGTLTDVTAHAADGSAVVFTGLLDDGRDVLGRKRNVKLDILAVDGQHVGSRTLDLEPVLYDAGSSLVAADGAFPSDADDDAGPALLLVNAKGRIVPIAPPRKRKLRDLAVEDAVLVGSRLVALSTSPDGLFGVKDGRLKPLVLANRPRWGNLETIDWIAASGSHLFVVATRSGTITLYELVRRTELQRLADLPAQPALLTAGGDEVAFTASISDDGGATFLDRLWIVDNGDVGQLLRVGDPSPVGNVTAIDGIAIVGRTVVFSASVAGDGARHALLGIER